MQNIRHEIHPKTKTRQIPAPKAAHSGKRRLLDSGRSFSYWHSAVCWLLIHFLRKFRAGRVGSFFHCAGHSDEPKCILSGEASRIHFVSSPLRKSQALPTRPALNFCQGGLNQIRQLHFLTWVGGCRVDMSWGKEYKTFKEKGKAELCEGP